MPPMTPPTIAPMFGPVETPYTGGGVAALVAAAVGIDIKVKGSLYEVGIDIEGTEKDVADAEAIADGVAPESLKLPYMKHLGWAYARNACCPEASQSP